MAGDVIVAGLVVVLAAWVILDDWKKRHPSDEDILKAQAKLEDRLREKWTPDHPGSYKAYICRELMYKWYKQISSQYRYDKERAVAIRRDWVEYLNLVQSTSTAAFLDRTSKAPFQGGYWMKKAQRGRYRENAIEDAFAALIGKEAVEELTRARE